MRFANVMHPDIKRGKNCAMELLCGTDVRDGEDIQRVEAEDPPVTENPSCIEILRDIEYPAHGTICRPLLKFSNFSC